MRQGQHNKRSRNRGRRQPNPSSRVFESNGPDVKIRGTASHIAEKYASLGRDAQAAGDNVAAENFFQHAEHYSRIVAAAQAYMQQQQASNPPRRANGEGTGAEDDGESATASGGANGHAREQQPDGDGSHARGENGQNDLQASSTPPSDATDGQDEAAGGEKPTSRRRTSQRKTTTRTTSSRRRRKTDGEDNKGATELPLTAEASDGSSEGGDEAAAKDDSKEDPIPAAG